jgi:catechol 2,3-dioxygenase-like lactoylglutathione lyase family enzyme
VEGAAFYDFIYRKGQPVRYEYIDTPWPLDKYQTVYGSVPGSVEMASAGRAFSWKLISQLRAEGIEVVPLQLHAGLSYYGDDRWPTPKNHPEEYHLPQGTVDTIRRAKKEGNRVIAVGTTVVRALETVAAEHDGELAAASGMTDLYITKESPLRVVDGLITGLHEPQASHLDLLRAFVSDEHLFISYRNALAKGYMWHEFGDMNLILWVECYEKRKSGESMKPHHIGINVKNLEGSKRFYQTHFGFSEEFTTVVGNEHILFLSRNEEWLELIYDPDAAPSHSHVHFAWEVEELNEEIDRLSRHGLEPEEGPIHLDNGWKAVFYKGPDRELIELISIK